MDQALPEALACSRKELNPRGPGALHVARPHNQSFLKSQAEQADLPDSGEANLA